MTLDRNRVTLIVAAAFTILAWGYKLWPSGKPAPGRPAAAASAAAQPAAAAPTPPPPPAPIEASALKTWVGLHGATGRDPFFTVGEIEARNRPSIVSRPTAAVSTVAPPLSVYSVKMIMTAGSERMASIDDRVVKVGDMMGTERVVQILPDAVVLEHGGERRRLMLSTNASSPGLIHIERVR